MTESRDGQPEDMSCFSFMIVFVYISAKIFIESCVNYYSANE